MKFEELLQQLKANNIAMRLVKGALKVFDPDKNLTPALMTALKQHKPALLRFISEGQGFTASDFKYAKLPADKIRQLQQDYPQLQNLYLSTPMQQGMLYHGMVDGSGASYTTQVSADLSGVLNLAAFRQAWQQVVARHDVFRTCFVGFEQSFIHQLVVKQADLPVTVIDWRQDVADMTAEQQQQKLQDFRKEDKQRGFDFAKPPLMRITLIQLTDGLTHFVWSQHHVLTDGWCGPLVFGEVMACYQAYCEQREPALPPVLAYENYIGWLAEQDKNRARNFWKDHLAGVNQPTPFYFDQAEADTKCDETTKPGKLVKRFIDLSPEQSQKLANVAKQQGCTVNVMLQLAWSYVLYRYNGEQAQVFGATISGRPADLPGMDKMVGLFINTVPVRVNLHEASTVAEVCRQLQQDNAARDEFGYLSLTDIHELSDVPNGQPLFNSLIVFENFPTQNALTAADSPSASSIDLTIDQVQADEQTNFAVTLGAFFQQHLHIKLGYRTDEISSSVMARVDAQLTLILNQLADLTEPDQARVMALDYLTLDEQQQLEQARTQSLQHVERQPFHSLQARFWQQVLAQPQSIALTVSGERYSYQQLHQAALSIAELLQQQGAEAGDLIGLYTVNSAEMVVGILGILYAGCGWVALDPELPASRIQFMIQDANLKTVVVHPEWLERLRLSNPETDSVVQRISIDVRAENRTDNTPVLTDENTPAYVIYTSGSTGQPKGVLIEQHSIVNFIAVLEQQCQALFADSDGVNHLHGWLWHTSFAFDAAIKGVLALCVGQPLVVATPEEAKDPNALARLIIENNLNVFNGVPGLVDTVAQSLLVQMEEKRPLHLITGGEAISAEVLTRLNNWCQVSQSRVLNAYGPTELTINGTSGVLHVDQPVTIGQPVANATAVVLTDDGKPAPIGGAGELWIGGQGVARGYLNRDDLTADRFITVELADGRQERRYRTGDKASWQPGRSGELSLHFHGRVDHQVKIRGYRIELAEIEHHLLQQTGVKAVTVLVETHLSGMKSLRAFVVPDTNYPQHLSLTDELATALTATLPEAMVPQDWTIIDSIPLTPGGKPDNRALWALVAANKTMTEVVKPVTELEQQLWQIWQQVLNRQDFGVEDNFFDLGGNSILAMQLMALAMQQGRMINPGQLFKFRTIRSLANELSPGQFEQASAKSTDTHTMIELNQSSARTRLFMLHPFGGLANCYADLAEKLASVAQCFGLQAPDLVSDDQKIVSIESLAAHYVTAIQQIQPHGPYWLTGWSTGAALAVEVAVQLQAKGERIAWVASLDGLPESQSLREQQATIDASVKRVSEFWYAPIEHLFAEQLQQDWHSLEQMTVEQGVAQLALAFEQQGLTPDGVSGESLRRWLRFLCDYAQAQQAYQTPSFNAPFTLYKVPGTDSAALNTWYNWDQMNQQTIQILPLQGSHKTLLDQPHSEALAASMQQQIKALSLAGVIS